ncbi:MAG: hypothetical protein QG672_1234, partial [Pseudomonadota bacterium]|nr:hypothetical protein [Pseudomonadota bacterium]
ERQNGDGMDHLKPSATDDERHAPEAILTNYF